MFKDKTCFWIIFDTCTRPEYYQDVHNLLALPYGSTMRYEYREKYLSSAAVKAASNPEFASSTILLIYAQWNRYSRGDAAPPNSTPSSEILWVPTRLAQMQLIPAPEGANFFFDFKVLGYPSVDDAALLEILNPLIASREVPFHKWVCLSEDLQALKSIQRGKESDNWQAIVDRLGTPPIQFSADSFVRLKGPFHGSKGRLLRPDYAEEIGQVDGDMVVRKVTSLYNFYDDQSFSLEAISHSPPPSDERSTELMGVQRRLEIQVDSGGPVSVPGDTSLDLRQYTGQFVRLVAKRLEKMDEKTGTVRFRTGIREDKWPIGANFSLNFKVRKRAAKVLAAFFSGVPSAVLLLLVEKLWDKDPVFGTAAAVIGVLLAVITALLLTGRLSFKL